MIISDCHVHSYHSEDSDTPMRAQIEAAIKAGLKTICFNDHHDVDFPEPNFLMDFEPYYKEVMELKEEYRDRIEVLLGIELGLQAHVKDEIVDAAGRLPYDFIIGSTHVIDGSDPYGREFWEGRDDVATYRRFYELTLENAQTFDVMDSYGHMDYIIRYGNHKNEGYSYNVYRDVLDEVLKTLIRKDIAIEANTAGYRYGLNAPNPDRDLFTRYRELGGRMITIGSDAHTPEYVGYEFSRCCEYLKSCGFDEYVIFKNRKPVPVKL